MNSQVVSKLCGIILLIRFGLLMLDWAVKKQNYIKKKNDQFADEQLKLIHESRNFIKGIGSQKYGFMVAEIKRMIQKYKKNIFIL